MPKEYTLMEALIRRRQLITKANQLHAIDEKRLKETIVRRKTISESQGVDEISAEVPKISAAALTKEYDFYAHRLRLIDASIQKLNWTTPFDGDESVWEDYRED